MSRILVIDDERSIGELLRDYLEKAGYDVQIAVNGDEGMRLFREQPADLIITDIFMPIREGLDTIKELHRDYPGVKIIAMSGGCRVEPGNASTMDFLSIAKEFGACATFSKPFHMKDILAAVDKLLGRIQE